MAKCSLNIFWVLNATDALVPTIFFYVFLVKLVEWVGLTHNLGVPQLGQLAQFILEFSF